MTKVTRRAAIAGIALAPLAARAAETLAWDFSFPSLDGGTLDFAAWKGRALLVVNTASFCGFAPQFRTLEALYRDKSAAGLVVAGMPSDDFDQEADNAAKIKEVCELTYGVEFPMTTMTTVTGKKANPFYAWVKAKTDWEPSWNFNKVLIGRDGRIREHYSAWVKPDGPVLQAAIGQALSASV